MAHHRNWALIMTLHQRSLFAVEHSMNGTYAYRDLQLHPAAPVLFLVHADEWRRP